VALAPRERDIAIEQLRVKYHQYEEHNLGVVLAIDVATWSGWAASGVLPPHGTAPD
jgi:hypothetical protein